jgi:hypothetical protein
MSRITGQIAALLNVREVVINRGAEEGVQEGMKFAILNRKGMDIVDPGTGEALGSVEVAKALVRVVRVHPHMAVARTFRKKTVNVGGGAAFGAILRSFEPPRYVDIPETLKIEEGRDFREIEEGESFVKRGDPAVQVLGEEFDVVEE